MSTLMLLKTSPGTILKNQLVPKIGGGFHPHLFDVYIPNGTVNFVVVALHGGSGGKQYLPQALYATYAANPTPDQVNWAMLEVFQSILIVPQGQHCDGTVGPFNPNGANTVSSKYPDGVASWSNYSMWSQADDKAMLIDMARYIINNFGNVVRVLGGHSNGGMMAHRMWFEAPQWYNFYCSTCGPMPIYWDSNIVVPAQIKPFYAIYSEKDEVLATYGGVAGPGSHFWDNVWVSQPENYTVAGYAYPTPASYVAGWRGIQYQATMFGQTFNPSGYTEVAEKSGTRKKWIMGPNGNQLRMDVYSEGAHGLVDITKAIKKPAFAEWMKWVFTQFT